MKRLGELDTDLIDPEVQAAVDEVCEALADPWGVPAGRPTIDRGWKTRRVTGAMVSVAAPDRARTTKGQKQDG